MARNWQHQTATQAAAAVRERFRSSEGEACCQIAKFIEASIADGSLTEADLRAAWGMNPGKWTTYRNATIKPLADALATVKSARGQ